ncbi:42008_t:CDS:1, partial [Gigaspora margarita]
YCQILKNFAAMLLYKTFIVIFVALSLLTYLTIALHSYEMEKHDLKNDKLEENELEENELEKRIVPLVPVLFWAAM